MEDGKIQLRAQEFNNWMEIMGQEITRVKDNLMLLETEERRLSNLWESGAKESWGVEFKKALKQVQDCVTQMEILTERTETKAQALAGMEKFMLQAAEEL